MGYFLIIMLIILTVGIPLYRGWLFMQSLKRHVNESFRGRQQHERPRRDDDDEYTATGERKIYKSGEGEYTDFEEVSISTVEETVSTSETIIEEQITDAEYEEISN